MKRLILSLALSAIGPVAAQAPVATSPASADVARQLAQLELPMAVEQAARSLHTKGDFANETLAWARAVELRPHLGRYKLELAAANALQDKKPETYTALLELQKQGYAFDLKGDKRFERVSSTEVWEYIVKGFDSNRVPFGKGKVSHTLPKQHELIESLAWDPSRKQLLVGSAREGKVFKVGANGALAPFVAADAGNGMWSVFDLVVDDKRGVLWIASTAVPHFQGYKAETDLGRAGIFKFDLKTGKFLKKFLSPSIAGQAFFLSTLALGKDGEVYAADGVNNAVYQVRDDQFRRLFHAPRLSSIRGLAVSGDGRILFIGDHERGVIGYDLAAGKPFDIAVPKDLTLGGIEGIEWLDGELVAIQSDMNPARVMRFKLAPDSQSITSVQPLAANQPELTLPTLGTLAGKTLYFIANSQKGNYDRFGLVRDAAKVEGTRIYALDAAYAPVVPKAPQPTLVPAEGPGG